MSTNAPDAGGELNALRDFSDAHAGILARIEQLAALPAELHERGPHPALAKRAGEIVKFFRDEVYEHHDQEERELFWEMAHAAAPGDEVEMVKSLCGRLTKEHRTIERLWSVIEPAMRQLAKGRPAELDAEVVARLVTDYAGHAKFEEAVVLPLSDRILKVGDKAALSLKLHLRHASERLRGYI